MNPNLDTRPGFILFLTVCDLFLDLRHEKKRNTFKIKVLSKSSMPNRQTYTKYPQAKTLAKAIADCKRTCEQCGRICFEQERYLCKAVQITVRAQSGDPHMRCIECAGTCTYAAPDRLEQAMRRREQWAETCEQLGIYVVRERAQSIREWVYGAPEEATETSNPPKIESTPR